MTTQHPPDVQQTTFSDPATEAPPPAVIAYTDGGCDPNPGPGGWAAVLCLPDREVVLQGNDPQSTNNRMELEAAIGVLSYLQGRYGACPVVLHTDSTYLQRGISEWIKRWVSNGWQTMTQQAVKNQDLWRALHDLIQVHPVQWRWVKGHAGDPLNERVDRLAGQARARLSELMLSPLPPEALSFPSPPEPSPTREYTVADLPPGAPVEASIAVSYQSDTATGCWAVLLRSGEVCAALSERQEGTTGNRILLQAASAALQALPESSQVTFYTSSDYLGRGANEWLPGWQRRGWRTAGGKPVANREHWQALLRATQPHTITWQVVRGQPLPADLAEAKRLAGKEGKEGIGD